MLHSHYIKASTLNYVRVLVLQLICELEDDLHKSPIVVQK